MVNFMKIEKFSQIKDFGITSAIELNIPNHSHEFFELGYIKEGKILHTLNGKTTVLSEGQYFFLDYNDSHSYTALSDSVLVVNIIFKPTLIDRSLSFCKDTYTLLRNYLIKIEPNKLNVAPNKTVFNDDNNLIWDLIYKMLHEYMYLKIGYIETLRSHLIELLIYTIRKIATEEKAQENLIDYAITKINSNYANPPTLKELAKKFLCSEPYVSLKFKQEVGKNYREYITLTRLSEAKRLLLNTNKKINDISEEVGYTDVNSFYITFKKYEGVSPNVFRKNFK